MSLKENIKALEGKPEAVLRNLLAEAQKLESLAKMRLYQARTRVVALPSNEGQAEHEELHSLSQDVDESITYVKAIKDKIEGKPAPVTEQNSEQEKTQDSEAEVVPSV